jgi:hypothetical protein
MDWEDIVKESSSLVRRKEVYQSRLGELAYLAFKERGSAAFETLAQDIEDTEGLKVSPATLRNKKWVYESIKDLGIPEDIPYYILQKIAGSGDASKWANLIIEEGYSGAEVARLIGIEKGVKKRTVVCTHCGKTTEI